MIDVLRIAHLRIAPQEGNLEVGNCEGNLGLHCTPLTCDEDYHDENYEQSEQE